jgi:hypothetical protein
VPWDEVPYWREIDIDPSLNDLHFSELGIGEQPPDFVLVVETERRT